MYDPFEEFSKAKEELIDVIGKEFRIYKILNWFEIKLKGVIYKCKLKKQ